MALGNNPSPIWRGVQKTLLNTAGVVPYTVSTETPAALIFSGKATNRPGETSVVVELFDILAPHLRQSLPPLEDAYINDTPLIVSSLFARRFVLGYGGSTENIDVRGSYDYNHAALAVPVTHEIPLGFPIVKSYDYAAAGNISLMKGGTAVLQVYNSAAQAVNVVFPTSEAVNVGDELSITPDSHEQDNEKFKIVANCGYRYGLYYVNAAGFWNCLPIRGIVKRTDSFERENAESFRRLNAMTDADRRAVRIDTSVSWEIHTGLLTDLESLRFSMNVPGSPMVFLFDLEDAGKMYPVQVVDTSAPHGLTIATNGRRPVDYTLTVQLLQDRSRL